jgi:hypothetical protein
LRHEGRPWTLLLLTLLPLLLQEPHQHVQLHHLHKPLHHLA